MATDNKDVRITVRFSQAEADAINRAAKLSGMSKSNLIRLIILRFLGRQK